MRMAQTVLLQSVLLFPTVALAQTVTDGQGARATTDSNFTFFVGQRTTGQLALRGGSTFFLLEPYDGTPSTQYRIDEFPPELEFFVNNRSSSPLDDSTYIGIEAVRLYTFSGISSGVYLYRNPDWRDVTGEPLPEERFEAPSLLDFIRHHSGSERDQPGGQRDQSWMKWHAHPSNKAPSSWERRDAIASGFGLTTNRNGYVPEDADIEAVQGTYRLIRFFESVAPNPQQPVRFTVDRHGARYLLVNVFAPRNGRAAYRNQYLLEIVSK